MCDTTKQDKHVEVLQVLHRNPGTSAHLVGQRIILRYLQEDESTHMVSGERDEIMDLALWEAL